MATVTTAAPSQNLRSLAADINAWWAAEGQDWDAAVMATDTQPLPGGDDLWDDMPKVDSKAIARTSPIFMRHLGVPLDVRLIRRGGYASIEDAIAELVPKMAAVAAQKLERQLARSKDR